MLLKAHLRWSNYKVRVLSKVSASCSGREIQKEVLQSVLTVERPSKFQDFGKVLRCLPPVISGESQASKLRKGVQGLDAGERPESIDNAYKTTDSSEATPVEVDRVEKGSKGKGKGKKGKGKSNWNIPCGVLAADLDVIEDRKAKERKAEDVEQVKEMAKERKNQDNQKGKTGPNQCTLCHGYGHWGINASTGWMSTMYKNNNTLFHLLLAIHKPILPLETMSLAKELKRQGTIVRRIFHITSTSSPSSPQNVRMASFEEIFDETEVEVTQDVQRVQDGNEEWMLLDSGSDVSLLPSKYAANIPQPNGLSRWSASNQRHTTN
eukprot:s580_g7.t1